MIKAVNTIRVKRGFAESIVDKFRELKGVKDAPGFQGMEVWKLENGSDHDEVKVCTTWASKEDFEAWTNSDAFKARHKHMKKDGEEDKKKEGPVLGAELTIFSVPVRHEAEETVK